MAFPDGKFALTFEDDRGIFYIPTVPAARSWRGPFPSWRVLDGAIARELGPDATVARTTVNGPPK